MRYKSYRQMSSGNYNTSLPVCQRALLDVCIYRTRQYLYDPFNLWQHGFVVIDSKDGSIVHEEWYDDFAEYERHFMGSEW